MTNLIIPAPSARWRWGFGDPTAAVRWGPWTKNRICKGYADLVAAVLTQALTGSGLTGYAGAQYLAVGSGATAWDTTSTPLPTGAEIQLNAESGRKVLTVVGYRQDNGTVVGGGAATTFRRPIVSASWGAAELMNTSTREAGLYGGKATATANSGTLLNLIYFPKIVKPLNTDPMAFTLYFEVELTLNYA